MMMMRPPTKQHANCYYVGRVQRVSKRAKDSRFIQRNSVSQQSKVMPCPSSLPSPTPYPPNSCADTAQSSTRRLAGPTAGSLVRRDLVRIPRPPPVSLAVAHVTRPRIHHNPRRSHRGLGIPNQRHPSPECAGDALHAALDAASPSIRTPVLHK